MTRAPTFEAIFDVMSQASLGLGTARVPLPDQPDLEDVPTRLAIALNVLLEDLAFRVQQREKAEERLRQSQKMEAIGNLAAGIAHDFNNLLSVILGYSDLALMELGQGDPVSMQLKEVKLAANRAAELTRQLLAFSRKQVLDPKVLDLNSVLAAMEKMLRRLLGEGVELSLLTFSRLSKIRADHGQLEQVVMNLVVNASDAMPTGGKLAIETANVELTAEYASNNPDVTPGPHVMLSVTDTGTGMEGAIRERVFEPFFTTKPHGRGTGLGLATVFGIVRQSGGHIWVYSEPNRGSTFKLYFPTTEEPAPIEPPALTRKMALGGSETVLLVEDEEQVRTLARAILGRNGYNVLEAGNAGEAFLTSESYPAKIHLLLTDVVMPRLTGKQLAERLVVTRPELKVLFMSGYSDSTIIHHGVLDAGVAYLQKPITPESLLRSVRAVLDAS
jgi:two-component system, cell cycle sensor histidine kinase and response regulator CckA